MHRDIAERLFPERSFFLCDYDPDRGDLVIRSLAETNIDVWFSMVSYVAVPVVFAGLEISELAGDRQKEVMGNLGWAEAREPFVVTALRGLSGVASAGFVVSLPPRLIEHDYPFRYMFPLLV